MASEGSSETIARPGGYTHPPLNPDRQEIRLLQAKKSIEDGKESLLTRMTTVSLLDPKHLPYKALSYVWYDTTPVYDPKVLKTLAKLAPDDASSPIGKLQESAFNAIWQMIDTENILTIWIDAVCINQEDNDERGSQVAMMASIYQNAEEIVAWLGPDSEMYGSGFQVIDRLAGFGKDNFEERWFQWCYKSDVSAEERRPDQYYEGSNGEQIPAWDKFLEAARISLPEWFEPDDANGRPPPQLRDFMFVGLSTFWTRAWIFQELAFSQKARIQSGSASTTLANFLTATMAYHALEAAAEYSTTFGSGSGSSFSHWNPGEFALTVVNRPIVNNLQLWNMMISLLRVRDSDVPAVPKPILETRLLTSFANLNATDPRDKIFGLWGFVAEGPNRELLRPDYNLSTEEVFSRAARYLVSTHRELTILATHSHGESSYEHFLRLQFGKPKVEMETLDLPSWVPDLRTSLKNSSTNQIHMWLNERHKGETPIFTDDEFTNLVKFSDDGRKLRILGMKVGKISAVYSGDMFPYLAKVAGHDEDDTVGLPFRDQFANFVQLAAHGEEILSHYFRFVFRSAEGTNSPLFDYETDLSEPISMMVFLDNGNITVNTEGTFGSRLIKFLVRLIGDNGLFSGTSTSRKTESAPEEHNGEESDSPESIDSFIASGKDAEIDPSKWWDAMTGAFDMKTWPQSMKDNLIATACGADASQEGREDSMKEIQSWIGTKRFNFFVVPGFGLGVCPDCIKPEVGDIVFRPAAHNGPMILRPVRDVVPVYDAPSWLRPIGSFKNVGECFVSHSLVRAMDNKDTMQSMLSKLRWAEIV
ncbi:hypothetical protein N0V90_009559 [Kalmusia sp. IMI 367209]|nr:hypothetical protein N0V90_009559 [Kalmusia sp. IMI 367209]